MATTEQVKAQITLTGCLSQAIGRYRFERNKPQITADASLIKACQEDGAFAVSILRDARPGASAGKAVVKAKAAHKPAAKAGKKAKAAPAKETEEDEGSDEAGLDDLDV